jgi:nucleotide-binding universal stress UspA family protein
VRPSAHSKKEVKDVNDAPILICYDGSDDSRGMIEGAAAVLGPRRAVVLQVEPTLTLAESFATLSSGVPGNEMEDLNESEALDHAQTGADLAQRAGFDARPRGTVASTTWSGVVDVADEIDASVIVISRGVTGFHEFLEGSVTREVAEHTERPVLVVPPQKGGVHDQ